MGCNNRSIQSSLLQLLPNKKVIPGSAVTFVTIIVPHTALWKAEDIVKAISAQTDATHQSNVWITLANKNNLKIEITKEGNWKVERNE